ncbi:hypothetical protein H0194_04575 [Corynebacterium incognita]|uniref:Uncharacterized protein n=1 Tax=Corynebacterium incognita TaxID=2754725 RepID=A0A7G7CRP2_9CORY|nr:hypothetical protein [Corynebacterium incognita]QNE90258.1 hypothetical protein H0194_04575 [Corynebacterium incognita]
MLIFAQPADVEAWAGVPLDDEAQTVLLIRRASAWVQHAVRAARFAITPAGLPADDGVMDALREATCEQVVTWQENGINPWEIATTRPVVESSSIGDANVNYDTSSGASAAQAKDEAANRLCDAAWLILDNAGLIGGYPWAQ